MDFAIETRQLSKVFDGIIAVDAIDLTVARGSITALLGGNGAGKTTTLAMMLGLLEPTSDSIRLLGHDLLTERGAIAPYVNFSSPYVDLPNRLTVRQNLMLHARLFDGMQPGVVVAESVWPNAAFEGGIGINALTSDDPAPPMGGAVFHDTAVWLRAAATG